jgi:hypothetical protein
LRTSSNYREFQREDEFAENRRATRPRSSRTDARSDATAWRGDFHERSLRGVINSLTLRDATLTAEQAHDMAVVLLQNMKTMKSLDVEHNAGAVAETACDDRALLEKQTRRLNPPAHFDLRRRCAQRYACWASRRVIIRSMWTTVKAQQPLSLHAK